jgi:peptidoglycan hydrolase CwlO-like protein
MLLPANADTQSQIDAAKAKIQSLVDRIASTSNTIAGLQADAVALADKIEGVVATIEENQTRQTELEQEVSDAEAAMAGLQGLLDDRAANIYEGGGGNSLEVLLGATSFDDFVARREFVDSAARSDQNLIEDVTNRRADLLDKKQALEQVTATLQDKQAYLERTQKALDDKLAATQSALSSLQSDKTEAEGLLRHLEDQKAKEELAAKLAAAAAAKAAQLAQQQAQQNQPPSGGGGGGGGGGSGGGGGGGGSPFSVCPVDQPRAYADTFGAPRYVGGYHPHKGNDIIAPQGTPIRAPFSGTATNASNEYGGLAVNVHGASGYVYNAHMSSIGQLGSVSAGTIIGYVGHTGSASGGVNHDHFEWHPNVIPPNPWQSPYGYSVIEGAIDPYPFLNQVC